MGIQEKNEQGVTRRGFLKTSATVAAGVMAAGLPLERFVHAAGNDVIRVGVIGIGGRGGGAVRDCLKSAPNVEVWAIGDYWPGKALDALKRLQTDAEKEEAFRGRIKATPETCFEGFDSYKRVIDSGVVDLIVTAAPPGFRPLHFRYAVEKGKHVFMEKPVATCPAGVRMVIEAGKIAKEKGLGVVAGTQRRHDVRYVETMQRIHDGAIGELTAAQCYWNGGRPWNRKPREGDRNYEWYQNLTEIEQQMYNWYHYTWLCGDHIVEQHIHNLDVINWAFSKGGEIAHPVSAVGVGGLVFHQGREPGEAWDCFSIDFVYPNGAHVHSMCRHWEGCPGNVSERVVGTRGESNCCGRITGASAWETRERNNSSVQEHTDLIQSIRAGKPLNEGESVAVSTGIAVMGRLAAYTGQEVKWDWMMNQSQLNLLVEDPKPGPHPVEGLACPGKTKLV